MELETWLTQGSNRQTVVHFHQNMLQNLKILGLCVHSILFIKMSHSDIFKCIISTSMLFSSCLFFLAYHTPLHKIIYIT